MQITYVALAAIAGCLLKAVDDAYDDGLFDKRIAFALNITNSIIAIVLMLNRDGFVVIGSVFWSSLFRGKVDNPAFRWGYLLVALVWGSLFIALRPFTIDAQVAILFILCVFSLWLMTKFHDRYAGKTNIVTDILIDRRGIQIIFLFFIVLLGHMDIMAFLVFAAFHDSYNVTGDFTKRIRTHMALRIRIQPTIKATDI